MTESQTLTGRAVSLLWCNALAEYALLYGPTGMGTISPAVIEWLTKDKSHWGFVLALSGLGKSDGFVSFYDSKEDYLTYTDSLEHAGQCTLGHVSISYMPDEGNGYEPVYATWIR